jgi:hypothetical protein
MSRWEPHIDLMRLLEALGNEIVSTTEQEVRQACAFDGWSIAMTAKLRCKDVRELIDAVNGEPGEPEVDVDKATSNAELRAIPKASPSVAAALVTSSLATSSTECARKALPPQIYATPSNLMGRWCNLAIRCCDAKRSGGYAGGCQ